MYGKPLVVVAQGRLMPAVANSTDKLNLLRSNGSVTLEEKFPSRMVPDDKLILTE